jgi:hypothetical protein
MKRATPSDAEVGELLHALRNPLAVLHANLCHLSEVMDELHRVPPASGSLTDAAQAVQESLQAAEAMQLRIRAWQETRRSPAPMPIDSATFRGDR